ncbi:MAG: cation diffusion facilitator family transporter [Planctomycetota bacterium]|jgi:cation diffusion facilitator family transporter
MANLLLFAAAALVFFSSDSQLVLAQGLDSLFDIVAGSVLALSAWVASKPSDDNHPFGHERAEPIGALVTAVLAGVLAFEVFQSAVGTLLTGGTAVMSGAVAGVLGGKFLLKAVIWAAIIVPSQGLKSPAVDALRVDTRNDLLACATSLIGFALVRSGYEWADAALAIPVAFYIGLSGFSLARENLRYLMGEAPSAEVLEELSEKARDVEGVLMLENIRAQHVGLLLHVEVEILIADQTSATQGHDIGVEVQNCLEAHEAVSQVFVHINTNASKPHS